jgi:hypothetical protein
VAEQETNQIFVDADTPGALRVADIQGMLLLVPVLKRLFREAALEPAQIQASDEMPLEELANWYSDVIRRSGGNRIWGVGTIADGDQGRLYFITGNGPNSEARARLLGIMLAVLPEFFPLLEWILGAAVEETGGDTEAEAAKVEAMIEGLSYPEIELLVSTMTGGIDEGG